MPANINDQITSTTTASGTRPRSTTVATLRSGGGTTLSCDDLTGWPTDSAVHFVTYQVDGSGEIIEGSQSDWKGIVSGSDINSLTLTGGTDDGNSVGDYVQMLPTAAWGKDLYDALTTTLNQLDGSLLSEIVTTAKIDDGAVTSAKLAPGLTTDANGWKVYDFGTWKEYEKAFGPGTAASTGASLSTVLSSMTGNFPVGIVPTDVFMQYTNTSVGTGMDRWSISPDLDMTSGSAVTTYSFRGRNLTGSTITGSDLYLTVRLKEK